jgi:Cupredoxin-like domain
MRRPAVLVAVGVAVLVAAGIVHAAEAPQEIALTIEKNRFQPEEIRVKAGAPFVLVITNKDGGPEDVGTYPFVGEYHEKTAQGRIVAE